MIVMFASSAALLSKSKAAPILSAFMHFIARRALSDVEKRYGKPVLSLVDFFSVKASAIEDK